MLVVLNLSKVYTPNAGRSVMALKEVSFRVRQGEFVSIVGPSGCGKTTLLMCIAGLMAPSHGEIVLNGKVVNRPPKEMVLIFQNYTNSLFPWKTVLGNVLFALENKDLPGMEKLEIAERTLSSVGLSDFIGHYPWELSGGMQQRVAMARGLAYGSEIVLMDEPFASVDAQTRADLEDLLQEVWTKYSRTVLFVTHDIDEAIYLSDRVIVLSSRPSMVMEEITVDLERPRDQLATKEDEHFIALRHKIYSMIKS